MAGIDLGAPLRGGKDGYLQSYFMARQIFAQMLATTGTIKDPRISIYTDFLISMITDREDREQIYAQKSQYFKENLNGLADPSEDEKAQATAEACMKVLGDVTSWFDEFLAITHRQTYGVCGIQPGEEEDEARFGGGGGETTNGNDNAECADGDGEAEPEASA